MTEGEFPFRSFTMRAEGYDRNEVDAYVSELRREIVELRRALETATPSDDGPGDTRLHDPEGAVTRTLAIAQETADRVLHDAQVESDRRRAEADEQATRVTADAEERAERLLTDIEAQAVEVRDQGVAAARSAIRVERDRAMSELSRVRRIRNSLRAEAMELKTALDTFRSQSRAASDTLAAAASGPLMSFDLPEYVDDDVMWAAIAPEVDEVEAAAAGGADLRPAPPAPPAPAHLRSVQFDDGDADDEPEARPVAQTHPPMPAFSTAAFAEADTGANADPGSGELEWAEDDRLAEVIRFASETATPSGEATGGRGSGAFLSEVRAAARDDVALRPENDESDRFLSELRELTEELDEGLDSEAADRFFDD